MRTLNDSLRVTAPVLDDRLLWLATRIQTLTGADRIIADARYMLALQYWARASR